MDPMGAIALLALVLIGWMSVGFLVWMPMAQAESSAALGDEAFRAGNFEAAAQHYQVAMDAVAYNAEYAFHAGSALHYEAAGMLVTHRVSVLPQEIRLEILSYYGSAIDRDPSDIAAYLARGEFASLIGDEQRMTADFDKALELNPNEVSIYRDYAVALRHLGLNQKAVEQLQLALAMNDRLDQDEPKRLSAEQIEIIHKQILAMGGGVGK
jgi:tetratricopeptide (TPR) repeat protein